MGWCLSVSMFLDTCSSGISLHVCTEMYPGFCNALDIQKLLTELFSTLICSQRPMVDAVCPGCVCDRLMSTELYKDIQFVQGVCCLCIDACSTTNL